MDDLARMRIDLSYDGSLFHGWAAQPGMRTVQGAVESALNVILRRPVQLTVAGRTDAGVHAEGQVAHLDLRPDEVDALSVRRLQGLLDQEHRKLWRQPEVEAALPRAQYMGESGDIVVLGITRVHHSFDARFSALTRHYRYRIHDRDARKLPVERSGTWWSEVRLDTQSMQDAAEHLLGEHDFLSFCRPREGASTIRELKAASVIRPRVGGYVSLGFSADAFCHSMVRSLVGALVEVGRGRKSAEWVEELVEHPSRHWGVPVAPACGLTLVGVDFPLEEQWASRAKQARNRRDI